MAIDRYTKDYQLKDSVDERGRIHTETEYIGKYYVFSSGVQSARTAGKRLALLSGLSWFSFLSALSFPSTTGHTFYALLPCVFLALPLWLLSTVAFSALRVKEPFIHREADRFSLRLPAAATVASVLSFLAILGGACSLIFGTMPTRIGDLVFLFGNLICFICAILCKKQMVYLAAKPQ
ncbi:MAG: hypothetical protein IJV40_13740 [Oscillospiraceae bacterium]|nr:hypothetical protein [Oscillospiraceae bacterium]